MSTQYKCKFCKHSLSSKRALDVHRNTAKYCLKLRGAGKPSDAKCEYCGSVFSQKGSLSIHLRTCREKIFAEQIECLNAEHANEVEDLKDSNAKYVEQIEILDDQIEILDDQIKDLKEKNTCLERRLLDNKDKIKFYKARVIELGKNVSYGEGCIDTYEKVGTTTTNNTINYVNPRLARIPTSNIRPLTIETIQEDVSNGKYTYELFVKGLPGLVSFVTDMVRIDSESEDPNSIERNYACTDGSRYKFHRLLKSKKWVKDDGAKFLGSILDELKEPAKEHITRLTDYIQTITDDPPLREAYDCILSRAKPIYFGIDSTGDNRKKLFETLRAEIKSIAAV